MQTTTIIPHPPYKTEWIGQVERLNKDLLVLVSSKFSEKVDGLDPEKTAIALTDIFEKKQKSSEFAKIICPIGTKPQTLGIYYYVRECVDPPAIVYASPLRHNHGFFSHGIGPSWILKLT